MYDHEKKIDPIGGYELANLFIKYAEQNKAKKFSESQLFTGFLDHLCNLRSGDGGYLISGIDADKESKRTWYDVVCLLEAVVDAGKDLVDGTPLLRHN